VSASSQANASTSSYGEDCSDFAELPPKELPLKDWFASFTVVDV